MRRPWCVLCHADSFTVAIAKVSDARFGIREDYEIIRCQACGLEQTWPRPSQARLDALYGQHYNPQGLGSGWDLASLYNRFRDRLLGSSAYRLWLALDGDVAFHAIRGTGRLLDIGCNEGRGLAQYNRGGFYVEGLESNPVAAATARCHGFTIHEEPLSTFRPSEPYDVIVLANVLEHFLDLQGALSHVRRLLKPGGRVYISCPNAESWQRRLFRGAWINWHVPFHIVHFNKRTLSKLCADSKFRILDDHQQSPSLWSAMSVVTALFSGSPHGHRHLRNTFLVGALTLVIRGIFFPILWLGNISGHGDCLIVCVGQE